MGSKFKNSRVGKFLTSPVFKGLITKIPFGVGSLAGDILNKNDKEEGTLSREKLVHNLVKLCIYGALAYFFLKGSITLEEAEDAKDLING